MTSFIYQHVNSFFQIENGSGSSDNNSKIIYYPFLSDDFSQRGNKYK